MKLLKKVRFSILIFFLYIFMSCPAICHAAESSTDPAGDATQESMEETEELQPDEEDPEEDVNGSEKTDAGESEDPQVVVQEINVDMEEYYHFFEIQYSAVLEEIKKALMEVMLFNTFVIVGLVCGVIIWRFKV